MAIRKLNLILLFCITSTIATVLFNQYFDIQIGGHFEGLYLLRDRASGHFDIRDHLFVGQEKQVIYSLDLNNSKYKITKRLLPKHGENRNHLHVEWNPRDGNGLVSSYFADGTGLVTYLGRYLDDDKEVHGLFVGGGLPETVAQGSNYNMNNSGMTYFDGNRWYHIWCSVNEGIGSSQTGATATPSTWDFLGSGVESKTDGHVVISSRHKTVIDDIPVRIDRKMHFSAGERYFILEIRITNLGTIPVYYTYLYGDEPWVGYYGTSLGDVGWVKERIVSREEFIDTAKHSFIGMADIGNSLINEKPVYTNLANFLEWADSAPPTEAYFTNDLNKMPVQGKSVPLESNERFMGLTWDHRLPPAGSTTIKLAIGMAALNPRTGIPEKPQTVWK